MRMLLVTGGNGKLGRLIVEELERRGSGAFAVSVRDVSAAADLTARGVEVRQADYRDPASLRRAFAGVDRLLLMPTSAPDPAERVAEHKAAVDAAVEAGVGHIVYPSVHAVDRFDTPLLSAHGETESLITGSGVRWTMLRNAIYADVVAADVQAALGAGELAAPVGDAAVAPVLRRDLAVATAAVLTSDGHEGRAYELTAPDTVDWAGLAALASRRSQTPVAYRPIDDAEAAERLRAAGLPEEHVGAILGFYEVYRQGWCGTPSPDFETLTGHPATPAAQAVEAVVDGIAY